MMQTRSLTQVFKGMMWAAIGASASGGSGDGTRRFSSQVPATKLPGDQATAKINRSPMAIEIDLFIFETSKGKRGFGHQTTFMKAEDDKVVAIVGCWWDDEAEVISYPPPVAHSALPTQAAESPALPVAPVATPRQASNIPQVRA